MADNEEGKEPSTRGNEWEVVSLTASAYAAAPDPKEVELKDDGKDNMYGGDEAETSRALFMSSHFAFPPSQHENLPLEPENTEILNEQEGKDMVSELTTEEGGRSSGKDDENWTLKELTVPEEYPGIQFFDEKGNRQSVSGAEFEEGTALQGLNLVHKEQSIYGAVKYSSLHNEASLGGSMYGEETQLPELIEPSEQGLDLPADISQPQKPEKDDKFDGSGLPCEAWWKRRSASLYGHAKEASTVWSIFIAAAVMGLVILGQRWQQERWHVLQIKWQSSINDERMGRMLRPIFRIKDVIVGGHRRGSFIHGSSSSES